MSIKMPKNIKEERLRWVLPIVNKEIKLVDAAKVCPHSQRSLERWVSDYKKCGESGLEPKSTRPRTHPNETAIRLKEQILELRRDTKLSAQKLFWQHEIPVKVRTIGKIIKEAGLTRKYRVRRIKYKYVKALLKPGELIEIDAKYVPKKLNNFRYFQFTAIDCASRWRYLKIYDGITNYNAIKFLEELINIAPFEIKAIKTDNDAAFTNRYTGYLRSADPNPRLHALDLFCQKLSIEHYLIDPGKPAQNGKVERSHRTDQEHFYDLINFNTVEELKLKLRLWNMYYNDLAHCGLNGQSPNEALQLIQPPNVRS